MPDALHLPLEQILQASRDAEVVRALQDFYDELDRRIAAHGPVCRNRGACCNFDSYGHQLRVTSLELAYFISRHRGPMGALQSGGTPEGALADRTTPRSLPVLTATEPGRCPFQQHGACTTRWGRPLGCRVFFCESEREGWQQELTEWSLAALKEMHQQFGVPYRYVDWIAALQQCQSAVSQR